MRLFLAAAILLVPSLPCVAQSPAQSHKASCKANTVPPSPAMLAAEQWDFKKAEPLFTDELKAHPNDERLHAASIRNLIALGRKEDANKEAQAFLAAAPTSSYARISNVDVMFRDGKLPESYVEAA